MTDRGQSALRRTTSSLEVGPSSMCWENDRLVVDIDEVSSLPLVNRIRGQVRLIPSAITKVELPLCSDNSHIWRPFAPISEIEVDIDRPGWSWRGHGYFDANFGTRALEDDFDYWTWGRFPVLNGAKCFYDVIRRDGTKLANGYAFSKDGAAHEIAHLPPKTRLPRSNWTVYRETRVEAGFQAKQVLPMLDAPFYTRAAVRTQLDGQITTGVHEALDLRRFRNPILKFLLACRVPRRTKWR